MAAEQRRRREWHCQMVKTNAIFAEYPTVGWWCGSNVSWDSISQTFPPFSFPTTTLSPHSVAIAEKGL